MRDRTTAGFIAGISAGIAMNVIDWLGYSIGLYSERLLDWAAVVAFGRVANNVYEIVFAQLGQIFFAGFLGILFAAVLLKLTSENHLIKGWVYGILAWFTIYAASIAIRLPGLEAHSLIATVSHFIASSVYGLVLAFVLNLLDKPLEAR